MQFENTKVYNFEGAFRGLRNPMNSWDRSDSYFGLTDIFNGDALTDVIDAWIDYENIGRSERNLEPYGLDMVNSNEYYDKCDEYKYTENNTHTDSSIYSRLTYKFFC